MIPKMYLIFCGNKTKGCMYIKDAGEQQPYKKGLKSLRIQKKRAKRKGKQN